MSPCRRFHSKTARRRAAALRSTASLLLSRIYAVEVRSPPKKRPLKGGARYPQRALARTLSHQRLGDKPLHLQLHRSVWDNRTYSCGARGALAKRSEPGVNKSAAAWRGAVGPANLLPVAETNQSFLSYEEYKPSFARDRTVGLGHAYSAAGVTTPRTIRSAARARQTKTDHEALR